MWNKLNHLALSLIARVQLMKEDGQALVEYSLILALISVVAIGALILVGEMRQVAAHSSAQSSGVLMFVGATAVSSRITADPTSGVVATESFGMGSQCTVLLNSTVTGCPASLFGILMQSLLLPS